MKNYVVCFVSSFDNEMNIMFVDARNEVEAFSIAYMERFKEAHPLDDVKPVEEWLDSLPKEFEALKLEQLEQDMVLDVKEVKLVGETAKRFNRLQKKSRFLNELENAGVDNWDGYSMAHKEYENTYGESYF